LSLKCVDYADSGEVHSFYSITYAQYLVGNYFVIGTVGFKHVSVTNAAERNSSLTVGLTDVKKLKEYDCILLLYQALFILCDRTSSSHS